MEKGKLVLTADLSTATLTRIYVNPCNEENKIENRSKTKWLPYEGLSFMFLPNYEHWRIKLIDSSGKDISNKAKNENSDWHENFIPASQKQIKKLTKKRSSLFKKADPAIETHQLFCDMPQPINKFERTIENILLQMQEKKDNAADDVSFGFYWINAVLGKASKGFIAVDIFENVPGLEFSETFEIEWNEKFNFSSLSFLAENDLTDKFFTNQHPVRLLGACVYDGRLYFSKQELVFPPNYIVKAKDTYMVTAMVDKSEDYTYITLIQNITRK